MKINIITCDACDRGNDDDIAVNEYYIITGREVDPSGNGYIDNWRYFDFCKECLEKYKNQNPKQHIFYLRSGKPL